MSFIAIRSLPFKESLEITAILRGLSTDFSKKSGIDLKHITATWEFYQPGQYLVGGIAKQFQPSDSHPILVEILAPDFNAYEVIEAMILTVASSLAERTGVLINNIFINCNLARSGMVFDRGKIISWSDIIK